MPTTVPDAVMQLLVIVGQLHDAYPVRKFTLDGRLVGDIGEVLAAESYDLELSVKLQRHHDAVTSSGQRVQIKATMKGGLTFPVDHVPDYYLGILINEDGSFREVFNGPGSIAMKAIENRKPTKTNSHYVPIKTLERLNKQVSAEKRIPRRATTPDLHRPIAPT